MINTRTDLASGLLPVHDGPAAQWCVSDSLVPYDRAVAAMDERVDAIARGEAPEPPKGMVVTHVDVVVRVRKAPPAGS